MAHLEWRLRCDLEAQVRLEEALMEAGALSVTLLDADVGTAAEVAVLEPGVGETPLWPHVEVHALFDLDIDHAAVEAAVATVLAREALLHSRWFEVEDQAWERAWLADFKPMRFGERLFIVPSSHEVPRAAVALGTRAAVVHLDPGLAFGTGTHATTALCLAWLDSLGLEGVTVVDVGCGSGVLAIAALHLGAARAVGIDNDPQALIASRDNADRNGVGGRLELVNAKVPGGQFADVIVANILAGTLVAHVREIAAWGKPGAAIALSGVLPDQAAEVADAFEPYCDPLALAEHDGWIRLSGNLRQATTPP